VSQNKGYPEARTQFVTFVAWKVAAAERVKDASTAFKWPKGVPKFLCMPAVWNS